MNLTRENIALQSFSEPLWRAEALSHGMWRLMQLLWSDHAKGRQSTTSYSGETTGFQTSIWWRVKNEDKSTFRTSKVLCTLSFYIWNMHSHHIPQSVPKIPDLGRFSFPVAIGVISPLRLCVTNKSSTSICTSVQTDWGNSECRQPSATTSFGTTEKH